MKNNESKKTIRQRSNLFRQILQQLNVESQFTSKVNEDCSAYLGLHKAYQRIRPRLISYVKYHYCYNVDIDNDFFLSYIIAILIVYYSDMYGKGLFVTKFPMEFPRFFKRCLNIGMPITCNSNIHTPSKRGTYKMTISKLDKEMSFFLRIFKADSEITQKLGYQLTKEQNDGIERLIANTTLEPEEKFQELMSLFYPRKI